MRSRSRSTVFVDLLTMKSDIATLAAYGANLGYDVSITEPDRANADSWPQMLLTRPEMTWSRDDLAAQVLLYAIATDVSPAEALKDISRAIEKIGAPLEEKTPVFSADFGKSV